MPRFARFTTDLCSTSDVEGMRFPFAGNLVTLICVSATGHVTQANRVSDKRALLAQATSKDLVLAAWPGQYRQDVFVVDDLAAARQQL